MGKHRAGKKHKKGGKGGESAGPAPPHEDAANLLEQAPLSGLTPGESVAAPPSASEEESKDKPKRKRGSRGKGKGKEPAGPASPESDDEGETSPEQAPLSGVTPGESATVPSDALLATQASSGDFLFSVPSNVPSQAEVAEAALFLPRPPPGPVEASPNTIPPVALPRPIAQPHRRRQIAEGSGASLAFTPQTPAMLSNRPIAEGSGASQAPTPQPPALPFNQETSAEFKVLEKQVEAKEKRIQELQIEKRNAIEETKKVRETRNKQKKEHDEAMENKELEIDTEKEKVKELEEAAKAATKIIEDLEHDLDQYKLDIENATKQITSMQTKDKDKQGRIDKCERERAKLNEKLNNALTRVRELEEQHEQLRKERDKAELDHAQSSVELTDLQARYDELETVHLQCCDPDKVSEELNKDFASLEVDVNNLEARLTQKDVEHDQAIKNLARARMENKRLRKDRTDRPRGRSPPRPETPLPPTDTTLEDEISPGDRGTDAHEKRPSEEGYGIARRSSLESHDSLFREPTPPPAEIQQPLPSTSDNREEHNLVEGLSSLQSPSAHQHSPIRARRTSQESNDSLYREPTPPPAEIQQPLPSTSDNGEEQNLGEVAPSLQSPAAALGPPSTFTTATTQPESSAINLSFQPAATVYSLTPTAASSTTDQGTQASFFRLFQRRRPQFPLFDRIPPIDASTQTTTAVDHFTETTAAQSILAAIGPAPQTTTAVDHDHSTDITPRTTTAIDLDHSTDITPRTTTAVDLSTQTTHTSPPNLVRTVNRSTQTPPASTTLLDLLPNSFTSLTPLSKFLLFLLLALLSYFIRDYLSLRSTRHALLSANDLTRQSIITLRAAGLRANGVYTFFGEGGSSWLALVLGEEAAARTLWSVERWLGVERGVLG